MVNIENHENRFADMESGWKVDVQSGRGLSPPAATEKWLVRMAGSG